MSGDELRRLRAEIDSLDEEVIRILALRFVATGKVGTIKAAQNLEAVDPSREAAQAERYSVLAARYGVRHCTKRNVVDTAASKPV
ncbi:chorismate mutase [Pseudomonas sp. MWU12-2345]|uniref:chorismate mutase n=1 Tax=Pseudomonas sp. MWU12-2345 TaxID=2928689 RepID=UPI00200CEB7B|nr:chorismate mutase [Pseudomonas sp. MWU12-2345]